MPYATCAGRIYITRRSTAIECDELCDVFYVRTEGDRAITVRDLSNGKMLVPEPPGVQVRRHLFEERDHNT